jgi:tetratricopeptide (TPR) repeat protein
LPYVPPSPFKEEFSDRPYDGEIAYMDYYVGKVVEKFKEKNIFDKTLILIAGDHGEALGDHGEVDHGLFLYESTMKVPFIVYAKTHLPSGLVVESAVRLIDIMPTLLDMVKIPAPGDVQGESLLPFIAGTKKDDLPSYIETVYPRENYGWSELIGLISDGWKYIQAPKLELYQLKDEPAEMQNLINSNGQRAREMKAEMERLVADNSSKIDASRKSVSQDELARLRSLGYIGGGATGRAATKLPDPKDRLDEYSRHYQARVFEESGDFSSAAAIYEEILEKDPDFEWTLIHLARIYTYLNRVEDCFSLLEEASKRNPNSFLILSSLAEFYSWSREREKAFEVSQKALRLNPHYLGGWVISGMAKYEQHKYDDAIKYFEKALEIEPENKIVRINYAHSLGATGRPDEALEVFSRLHEEYPQEAEVFYGLGLVHNSIGEIDKARVYVKKAVELDPSPKRHLDYASIAERAGDLEEAIRYITRYLEITQEGDTPQKRRAQRLLAEWQKRVE